MQAATFISLSRALAALLGVGLIAGCASQASTAHAITPAVVILRPIETDWFGYWRRARAMTPEALARESADVGVESTAAARLASAILLSVPDHPLYDAAQAQAIAEVVAENGDDGHDETPRSVASFAALFAQWLDDQRQADLARDSAALKSRDDEKRMVELETRLRDAERRAAESERRASEAEKKLEALKQIDKALSERPSGAAVDRGAAKNNGG